jgi:hypothetical protein
LTTKIQQVSNIILPYLSPAPPPEDPIVAEEKLLQKIEDRNDLLVLNPNVGIDFVSQVKGAYAYSQSIDLHY